MRRISPLLAFLLLAAPAIPAAAKAPTAPLDPQTLVSMGKRPAFYDPHDLSKPPVLSAKSALLMDGSTGQILWEKNGSERRAPASTTKILTGLLVAENTRPADIITVMDPKVKNIEGSSLYLKPWEKLSARALLYGIMLRSANDGCVVAAEHIAGSVPAFAERMNARARELGALDTHFTNPNGLPDPAHYTTARDLAVIARAALTNPRFADAVHTPRRTIVRSKQARDTVLVAKSKRFYQKFPGADGVKTGYTRQAGHCFVGSATRNGRRLISVVLGAVDSATGETIPLLSWGFARFPAVQLAKKGEAVGSVAVRGGRQGEVPVTAGADLTASTDVLAPAPQQAAREIEARPVPAPVLPGQEVGRLVARVDGTAVGSVPLLAAGAVERSPVAAAARTGGRALVKIAAVAGLLVVGVRLGTTAAKGARRRGRRVPPRRRRVNRRR